MRPRSVLIIESVCKRYRAPFYLRLAAALGEDEIRLTVVYSKPDGSEAQRCDTVDLPTEIGERVPALRFMGLLLQAVLRQIRNADLVIVDQDNRLAALHLLIVLSKLGLKRVAFWGHGYSRCSKRHISQWWKRVTLPWANWWFAYTTGVRRYLLEHGVHPACITIVQNAIDITGFSKCLAAMDSDGVHNARAELKLPEEAAIGLFCGGLYPEKDIEFLVASAEHIRQQLNTFHLLVLGAGPMRDVVEAASRDHDYIRYLGPDFGARKLMCFKLAHAMLMPGAVGLGILDAFAAGKPVVTTRQGTHGPEIEYLQNGVNGIMVEREAGAYAAAVVRLLTDTSLYAKLCRGASRSASRYTLDAMVENFRLGINAALIA